MTATTSAKEKFDYTFTLGKEKEYYGTNILSKIYFVFMFADLVDLSRGKWL